MLRWCYQLFLGQTSLAFKTDWEYWDKLFHEFMQKDLNLVYYFMLLAKLFLFVLERTGRNFFMQKEKKML